MSDSSGELSAGAARGDAHSKEARFARHLDPLFAFVRLRMGALLRSRESSADIVDSVFREVLQDIDQFEYQDEAGARRWLFQHAERKIIDRGRYWRRSKRDIRREVELDARSRSRADDQRVLECYQSFFTPSRDAQAHEELARVEAAFEELPEDYREVILLSRIVGLPHAEIATRLNRTEGAVRTLLSRALARLSTLLEPQ